MKKRILAIIEVILLGISFTFWETNYFIVKEVNFSGLSEFTLGRLLSRTSVILPLIFWILFLIYLVMCCISIFSNKGQNRNNKIFHRILAVCVAAWYNLCMIITVNVESKAYRILSNDFPTVIFELCLLAMIVVAFIKTAGVVSNDIAEKPKELNSNTDELKKYKELLDSGVITQEEFDAKKKQLLNL